METVALLDVEMQKHVSVGCSGIYCNTDTYFFRVIRSAFGRAVCENKLSPQTLSALCGTEFTATLSLLKIFRRRSLKRLPVI